MDIFVSYKNVIQIKYFKKSGFYANICFIRYRFYHID
jgi:hypothetical protein